jgi:RND superfamily putative drug exporter
MARAGDHVRGADHDGRVPQLRGQPVALVKMMGLGLSTAIVLDATIVRMVVVPATMALMGRANWWLPGWLDRLLPRVALEAPATAPDVAPEPVGVLAPTGY